jgi:SnoaL-like domain
MHPTIEEVKTAMSMKDAKEVVMSCVDAINKEDFKKARQYVAEDMSFVGVLGSRQGADSYFHDMERMRLKYDVKKVFVDGNDVCLFYDLTMSEKTILVCAWYEVQGGKIRSLKVAFDPRPLLAGKAA